MTKINTKNFKFENFLIPLALFSILPFVILFIYNHPSADDFFFFTRAERAGFFSALKSLYFVWSGRIFTHAQLLLYPMIFKTFLGYKIFTLFLMILYFIVLHYMVKEFTGKNLSKKEMFLISFSVFFLYLYQMSVIGEGLYNFTSVVVYHNTVILMMLFLIFYNRIVKSKSNLSIFSYTLVCCILAFAVCLSNEVPLMTLGILTFIFLINNTLDKKWNWSLFLIIIAAAIATYIDFASPGTIQRKDVFPGNRDFVFSFMSSFSALFSFLFSWIILTPILPVTVLLLPVLSKLSDNEDQIPGIFKIPPVLVLLIGGFLIYAGFFVSYYGLGKPPFGRITNILYFEFLITWFYFVITLIKYLSGKFNYSFKLIPKYISILSFAVILLFLIKDNNIQTAYTDLIFGVAKQYDVQIEDRNKLITGSTSDTVAVKKLKNVPRSMFYYDISEDPSVIYNQWYSKYFKKKAIYLTD